MIEKEMEDLMWEHPEKFFNEPLRQFKRQLASPIGRADIIFLDRIGSLIVVEIKHGVLPREAITQIIDYSGMLHDKFPDKVIELMIIANEIPRQRRLACEKYNIEHREISEKKFRDVAKEIGYIFQSEIANPSTIKLESSEITDTSSKSDSSDSPSKVEKGWYYWKEENQEFFLAFVNQKGSCSMRWFRADDGTFWKQEPNKSGDYQTSFSEYVKTTPLHVKSQPSLVRARKNGLPSSVLKELKDQIINKVGK